jgi:NTE family protein
MTVHRRQLLVLAAAAATAGACSVQPDEDHNGPHAPEAGPLPAGKSVRIAWVLGSGGPRGFVHLGVLKALVELGLKPNLVVGSSVGAVVGCLFAGGVPIERLLNLGMALTAVELARWSPFSAERLNGGAIAHLVRQELPRPRMEQFPVAMACVATRARDSATVAFTRGDAGVAVQASAAVEGQFTPVRIRGERYVDPDFHTPLPVRLARSLGAQRVLAVDASAHEDKAPPGAERFREWDLRKRHLTQPDAVSADVLLHSDFGYWAGFSREYRERLIQAGYQDTMANAQRLRALHQA